MTLLVEMGWGGSVQSPDTITWTDITEHVDVAQGVSITRGASDELAETQPGTATLVLDNADGKFTPGNTSSPYYPFVRRNAPIRVSVAAIPRRTGSAPYPLAMLGDTFDDSRIDTTKWTTVYGGTTQMGGRARIPVTPGVNAGLKSAQSYSLANSRVVARLVTAPSAGGSSSGAVSMWVHSTTAGTRVGWLFNPATQMLFADNQAGFSDASHSAFPYSPTDHAWLRIRESGGTVYWETSSDGGSWTVRRSVATPAWVTSQSHAFEFTGVRTGGSADYVEWDLLGAEMRRRFYGLVNEWPVAWEGLYSKVSISATDRFKLLNRRPSLRSALAEEAFHPDVIVDYKVAALYPLAEEAGTTSAGDLSGENCGPLVVTSVGSGGTCEFGTQGLAGTGETCVTLTPVSATVGKYLVADLGPRFEADDVTMYTSIGAWFKTSTSTRAIMGLYSPNADAQLIIGINASGRLTVETAADGSVPFVLVVTSETVADGVWHHVLLDLAGPRIYVDGVPRGITPLSSTLPGLRLLHVGGYRGARLFSGQIAQLAFAHTSGVTGTDTAPEQYAAGTTGFAGEGADERIRRLARYGGVTSVSTWGTTHDPVASQAAAGSAVVARMREVETTESGRLYARRDSFGLDYQSRDVRYNPSPSAETFTIAYADLEPGISLADDDQKLVNLVDASRPDGATQRVSDAASITAYGEYPQDLTLLKTDDNSVLDAAAWLVSRYANPVPELREVPVEAYTLPAYEDILTADISSYFSVYGLPAQAPTPIMRVTVEGYSETITDTSHRITFVTSASATDSVWVLDDPAYALLGTTTRLAY